MVDVRLWFQKRGDARYISHLDLSRCMQRALKRSQLPVWYTEGFNPHAYVTFALPLSLGQESRCDIMDFRLEEEMPMQEVLCALQRVMPPNLPAVRCAAPVQKTREIGAAAYEIRLSGRADFLEQARLFLGRDSITVMKRTKKGGEKELDLAPFLTTANANAQGEDLVLSVTLPAGSDSTVNPSLVVGALENAWCAPCISRIVRLSILDKSGQEFC